LFIVFPSFKELTMRSNSIKLNPFALMMEPEAVLQAMERSNALRTLRQQVFHPLDKPMRSMRFNVTADLAAFDAAVENGVEPESFDFEEANAMPPRFI
jgi:hypothetical protein